MWICLNEAFLTIVLDDTKPSKLLVRARVRGHIEGVFPRARVRVTPHADHRYRAEIGADEVAHAITRRIAAIDYRNFKASVRSRPLHDAYVRVWAVMAGQQSLGGDGERKNPRRRAGVMMGKTGGSRRESALPPRAPSTYGASAFSLRS